MDRTDQEEAVLAHQDGKRIDPAGARRETEGIESDVARYRCPAGRRGHHRPPSPGGVSSRMGLYGSRGGERRRSDARVEDARIAHRTDARRYDYSGKRICPTPMDQSGEAGGGSGSGGLDKKNGRGRRENL